MSSLTTLGCTTLPVSAYPAARRLSADQSVASWTPTQWRSPHHQSCELAYRRLDRNFHSRPNRSDSLPLGSSCYPSALCQHPCSLTRHNHVLRCCSHLQQRAQCLTPEQSGLSERGRTCGKKKRQRSGSPSHSPSSIHASGQYSGSKQQPQLGEQLPRILCAPPEHWS